MNSPHVALDDRDPRRLSLSEIVRTVWERYRAEILITETSRVGLKRENWIMELATQVEVIRSLGIPLGGVCWYPILEMPDWHQRNEWTAMGLWDLDHDKETMDRIPYHPGLSALHDAEMRLGRGDNNRARCAYDIDGTMAVSAPKFLCYTPIPEFP